MDNYIRCAIQLHQHCQSLSSSLPSNNIRLAINKSIVVSLGGIVSVTATEWMMDGSWPDDITPKQFAQMIDGAVKVAGIDYVGIGTDDMMTTAKVVPFAMANADKYADNGYMIHAFEKGATGCGELSKHLAATTDELWKLGNSNDDLKKLYGGNLLRVYKQTWK